MYYVLLAFQCLCGRSDEEVKVELGRREVRFLEDGREWGLSGLLYADDLVLFGESEEDLRVMVG